MPKSADFPRTMAFLIPEKPESDKTSDKAMAQCSAKFHLSVMV
jgi:hypothetical protein